ncbi:THUMP-like domain-containing protein [Solitalea koreensis]|uniref:Methyltransferase domain-containing protein n=1 Tax=Solitalea koreensis TaxID=543615 RepID=A0A521BQQ6_9SPHI|nr:methyltransferase domain-containing protein [Solitalea koreensis]SMO49504.1 Methyltransferase domain-containing protein [Solitalea koreensis]
MTLEDFKLLTTAKAQQLISDNRDQDPIKFALTYRQGDIPVALLSTQLKYLQRCKAKLPSYFAAQCIIPPLSYEQSSSETAASLKDVSGETCLDLTCGLGVDSFHFSQHFKKVISLEMMPVLAAIAQYNLNKLGATNIEVLNQRAENFLQSYQGPKFDLLFVDPARRDDSTNRVFLFEDCSPNLYETLPLMKKNGKRIIVKASPLFDIDAAWKCFPELQKLSVVSVDNECKELLLEFNSEIQGEKTIEILLSRKGETATYSFNILSVLSTPETFSTEKFLLEPDVAFYKARKTKELMNSYFKDLLATTSGKDGFFFSENAPVNYPGRIFNIINTWDYQPKFLKKQLKTMGIKKANVIRRHFPSSVNEIRKALGVTEGGDDYLICTTINEHNKLFLCKRSK